MPYLKEVYSAKYTLVLFNGMVHIIGVTGIVIVIKFNLGTQLEYALDKLSVMDPILAWSKNSTVTVATLWNPNPR